MSDNNLNRHTNRFSPAREHHRTNVTRRTRERKARMETNENERRLREADEQVTPDPKNRFGLSDRSRRRAAHLKRIEEQEAAKKGITAKQARAMEWAEQDRRMAARREARNKLNPDSKWEELKGDLPASRYYHNTETGAIQKIRPHVGFYRSEIQEKARKR